MSIIFDIGHETDLSEYDSFSGAADLSADAAAALAGTAKGLKIVVDSTADRYGRVDFTQLTSAAFRFRLYLKSTDLTMADSDEANFASLNDGGTANLYLELSYSSGYRIRVRTRDDGGTLQATSNVAITAAEHYVEVLTQYASSSSSEDGVSRLWIDGIQQAEITNLDLYSRSKPDNARLGFFVGIDAGTSGTLYLDEFLLRDDDTQIGPYVAPACALPILGPAAVGSALFGGAVLR